MSGRLIYPGADLSGERIHLTTVLITNVMSINL